MPNECFNSLHISSNDIQQLDNFVDQAICKNSQLSFSTFLPCIDQEDPRQSKIDNWGTYREPLDIEYERQSHDTVTYSFYTAWSPPIKFLEQVSLVYPALTFYIEFEEPGVGLFGNAEIINGNVFEEDTSDIIEWLQYSIANICANNTNDVDEVIIGNLRELKLLISQREFEHYINGLDLSTEIKIIFDEEFKECLIVD